MSVPKKSNDNQEEVCTWLKETQADLPYLERNDPSYCMPTVESNRWRKRCAIHDKQKWYTTPPGEPRPKHKWRAAMRNKGVIMRYMVHQEAFPPMKQALMQRHEEQNPPRQPPTGREYKPGTYLDELTVQGLLTFMTGSLSACGIDDTSLVLIEHLLSSMRVLYNHADDPMIVVHTLKSLAIMVCGNAGSPSIQILDFLGLRSSEDEHEPAAESLELAKCAGDERYGKKVLEGASWFRSIYDSYSGKLLKKMDQEKPEPAKVPLGKPRPTAPPDVEDVDSDSDDEEEEEETSDVIEVNHEALSRDGLGKMLDSVKVANDDYERAKETEGFGHVTKLLTYALAMGLCGKDSDGNDRKKIEWKFGNLKLLSIQAAKEAVDSKDLIEATLRTAKFVLERGNLAMEEKSIIPFFAGDLEKREFYDEYNFIVGCEDDINPGRLDLHDTDLVTLTCRTTRLIKVTEGFLHRNMDSRAAREWNMYKLKLEGIKTKCRKKMQANATRVTPFAGYFMSAPGCGKSSLVVQLAKMMLLSRGLPIDGAAIANKLSIDPYDTVLEWLTRIVLLDDMGAADDKNKEAATFFLQGISRIPYQLVKAIAEEKGQVELNALAFLGTGNGDDAGLHRLLPHNTGAGVRRWTHGIFMQVKPKYRSPTGAIDTQIVERDFPGQLFAPIQTFTLYEPVIQTDPVSGVSTYSWNVLKTEVNGVEKLCLNLEIGDFMPLFIKQFNEHIDRELRSIQGCKSLTADDMCPIHYGPKDSCGGCKGTIDLNAPLRMSNKSKTMRTLEAHVGGQYDGEVPGFEEHIAELEKSRKSRRPGTRPRGGKRVRFSQRRSNADTRPPQKSRRGKKAQEVKREGFLDKAGVTLGGAAALCSSPKSVMIGAAGTYLKTNGSNLLTKEVKEVCPAMYKTARDFYHSRFCRLTSYIPDSLMEYEFISKYVSNSAEAEYEEKWKHIFKNSAKRAFMAVLFFNLFLTVAPWLIVYLFFTRWEDLDGIYDVRWDVDDMGLPYMVGELKEKYWYYEGYDYSGIGNIGAFFRESETHLGPFWNRLVTLHHRVLMPTVSMLVRWKKYNLPSRGVCRTLKRSLVHWVAGQPGRCYDERDQYLGQVGIDVEKLNGKIPRMMSFFYNIRGLRVSLAVFTLVFVILFILQTRGLRDKIRKRVYSDRFWTQSWMEQSIEDNKQYVKDNRKRSILIAGVVAAALLAYVKTRTKKEEQCVKSEMANRGFNVTQKSDIWNQNYVPAPTPTGPKAATMTQEQACNKVAQNCCYVEINGLKNHALGLRGSELLVPKHGIPKGNFKMKFWRQTAGCHTVDIHASMVSCDKKLDAAIIDIPGHKFHDITDLLPTTEYKIPWLGTDVVTPSYDPQNGQVSFYEGRLKEEAECRVVEDGEHFKGFTYGRQVTLTTDLKVTDRVPPDTTYGDCGIPAITMNRTPVLVGIHIAGFWKGQDKVGVILPLTKPQVDAMRLKLKQSTFYMPVSNECSRPVDDGFGRKVVFTDQIHPKNPVNFTEGAYSVIGAVSKQPSSFKTSMEESILSGDIKAEIGGLDLAPVKLNPFWESPQKTLEKFASPWAGFDMDILEHAVNYVHDTILNEAADLPELAEARPLEHEEILNGIDGVWGINSLNWDTGICYPIGCGKKSRHAVECPPLEGIESVKDIPGLKERHEEYSQLWLNGETVGIPFVMFPKTDEVRPTEKLPRQVNGCGIDLVYAVRKYFLPVSRVIQSLWRKTGAVLGQNCYGEDWTKIATHLQSLHEGGQEAGCLPGDYSAFDTRQTNLLLRMAWKILILLAMESGNYTTDEINIMFGIASEVNIPMVVICDVLVQLFGGNMSGHPLTTIINSIVNMLLIVYVTFVICGKDADVDATVRFVVLGDDSIVVATDKNMKHSRIQEVLAKVGCKYTLDVKTSEAKVDSVPFSIATFCKRGFAKRPEGYAAPLIEESIWKSLYFTSDKKREKEILEVSIMNAMFEWHMHGEEVFNKRREFVSDLCEKHGLLRGVPLPVYDECYARWVQYQSE